MSILSVLQLVMPICGLPQPSQAVSSTDPNVIKFVALAQDIGDELRERFFWRNLNIAGQLTGDGTTTLFGLPSDWAQLSPGQDFYSSLYPLLAMPGPVSNETMAALKASAFVPTRPVWRIIGGTLEFFPAPGLGEIITFNYYSTNWVSNAAALQRQPGFALDSDFSMIDEIVLRRGLIWRWKASKGLDYAEDFRAYQMSLDRAAGREDAQRVVSTSNRRGSPDTWFPGTITDLTDPIN
jgi:hypothetical protein